MRHCEAEITGLEEAWKSGSLEELYQRAHRVKGGVGTLRAKRAMHLAQQIEAASRRGDKEGAGKLVPELVAELRHIGADIRDLRGQPD